MQFQRYWYALKKLVLKIKARSARVYRNKGLMACLLLGLTLLTLGAISYSGVFRRAGELPWFHGNGSISHFADEAAIESQLASTQGGTRFYADPHNDAINYYESHKYESGASFIKLEGEVPTAAWFGDWTDDVRVSVDAYVSAADADHATPVLALYNIPKRDCGGYSAGGALNDAAYNNWIQEVAAGIGVRHALVILEPDALPGMDCLKSSVQRDRTTLLSRAVRALKTTTASQVYIDAGNPEWQSVQDMAGRLKRANIAQADGFSLNVSNYISTSDNQHYGDRLSALVGDKHYVIDTSRNGNGSSDDEWCNARSGALGSLPTTQTGDSRNDAFLWIKIPWESGGSCNGDPAAGQDFWSYAVRLAKNAHWQ
jgi:endoglucanase